MEQSPRQTLEPDADAFEFTSAQSHSDVLEATDGPTDPLDLSGLRFRRLHLTVRGNSWNPVNPTEPVRFHVILPPDVAVVSLRLVKDRQARVVLSGLPTSANVQVVGPRNGEPVRLLLPRTPAKGIHVMRARLDLDGLDSRAKSQRFAIDRLEVENGELHVSDRNVSELMCSGKCVVQMSRTPIGNLTTQPGTVLTGSTEECRIRRHESAAYVDSSTPYLILLNGSNIEIEHARSSHIVIRETAVLRLSSASDLTIRGPGTVTVSQVADRLRFAAPAPRLSTARHAAIVAARGEVILDQVADCSIAGVAIGPTETVGDNNALTIRGVNGSEAALKGVSLSDFSLPVTLGGLSMISMLDKHAQHVSPLIHGGLPGLGALTGPRLSAYRQPALSGPELLVHAEYSRALSDLARSKGAAASVRTTLAWARYRMRSIVAPRRSERWLLGGYRLLGYGERFFPPLLLFVVAVVFLNVLSLRRLSFSLEGSSIGYWFHNLLDWAATPLHILRLTDPVSPHGTFAEPWNTAARLLVAVPFATAVLVMRKYIKEDDRRT